MAASKDRRPTLLAIVSSLGYTLVALFAAFTFSMIEANTERIAAGDRRLEVLEANLDRIAGDVAALDTAITAARTLVDELRRDLERLLP